MGGGASPGLTDGPEHLSGFYDSIADDYHLAVSSKNLRETVESQGLILESILRGRLGGGGPWTVLDCSCGIGTQALGLALRGHRVVGIDLSPRAIERAKREAASLVVDAKFAVADMRHLDVEVNGVFDVVLSCGNSLAHFGTGDLGPVLLAMRSKVREGGVVLVSIRDYDALAALRPRVPNLPRVHDTPSGKRIIFQIWDWEHDASSYLMTWLFLSERPDGFESSQVSTRLHAHRRSALAGAFESIGFADPAWHLAHDEPAFEDPVMTALLPDKAARFERRLRP
jgi:glycine/sarcosine N-methyltransferase